MEGLFKSEESLFKTLSQNIYSAACKFAEKMKYLACDELYMNGVGFQQKRKSGKLLLLTSRSVFHQSYNPNYLIIYVNPHCSLSRLSLIMFMTAFHCLNFICCVFIRFDPWSVFVSYLTTDFILAAVEYIVADVISTSRRYALLSAMHSENIKNQNDLN